MVSRISQTSAVADAVQRRFKLRAPLVQSKVVQNPVQVDGRQPVHIGLPCGFGEVSHDDFPSRAASNTSRAWSATVMSAYPTAKPATA